MMSAFISRRQQLDLGPIVTVFRVELCSSELEAEKLSAQVLKVKS